MSKEKKTYMLIGLRACEEWDTVSGEMTLDQFKEHCVEEMIDALVLNVDELTDEAHKQVKDVVFFLENEGWGNGTDFSLYKYVYEEVES
tara:strand:+ start:951 stop:1217 length:267 start_codon:yes stop_codon:yes gene_type:complete